MSEAAEAAVIEEDLQAFILEKHEFQLIDGRTFQCPRTSWGKELQIIHLLRDLVKVVLKSGVFKPGQNVTAEDLITLLDVALDNGPEKLTQAVSVLIEQDAEWVKANMAIESIMGLLVPYLRSKRAMILIAVRPYMGQLKDLAERAQAAMRSASTK